MYPCVEDLLDLDDAALKEMGVRNTEHRSKMLSSLVRVQAKRRQSMNLEGIVSPQTKNPNTMVYLHNTQYESLV